MLIDTHCHLDHPTLLDQLALLLDDARAVGVTKWVIPAVHPDGWHEIAKLCVRNPTLRPAYGIHPLHAAAVQAEHLRQLDNRASQGVAIGEIGLDRRRGDPEQQEILFREQLRIARRHGLPVLIHCVHAIGRTLEILQEEQAGEFGGVMHAFSGSVESAREFIKLGFVISLSGAITYSSAVRVRQLAKELPLQTLVLETDAPCQAPASRQGELNRPAWLLDTAIAVAAARNIMVSELAAVTSLTAIKVIPNL